MTKKIRIAAFIAACLTSYIQAAHSADLPVKARNSHEASIDQVRLSPAAKEILFQKFLEWLKQRDRVVLRSAVRPKGP
jgi:hypothetical protein